MTAFESVPVVDLTGWRGTGSERLEVAREVDRVFRDVGFMYLAGHGLPQRLLDGAFRAATEFFALPAGRKAALDAASAGSYWGYYPDRSEASDPNASADRKEAFDLHHVVASERLDAAPESVRRRLAAPNLWPEGLAGFRPALEAYFAAAGDLARTLFEVIAVANGLQPDWFASSVDDPIVSMRLLHYPPQPARTEEFGIGAHHDYEALTILAQDEVGGLQVRNPDGDWVDAPPVPGTFVVNIGEMLARWSGDAYVATDHRVVNRSGKERYSIPVFFASNHDTVLRSWHGTDKRPPMTAGEYLVDRIDTIYGAPPRPAASPQ
jgi:isopenicillin N synthase-like dioxygenase